MTILKQYINVFGWLFWCFFSVMIGETNMVLFNGFVSLVIMLIHIDQTLQDGQEKPKREG